MSFDILFPTPTGARTSDDMGFPQIKERKKIKVGDVFEHPDLGLVAYKRTDVYYGQVTCELVRIKEKEIAE